MNSASVELLLAVVTSVVLVVVAVVVCVRGCHHFNRRSEGSRKSYGNGNIPQAIYSITENDANFCVNGVEVNGEVSNGWLVSHDRALPEIPVSASGVASTDDDDDDDEGHYDVISKNRRGVDPAATSVAQSQSTTQSHCTAGTIAGCSHTSHHPYELVAGDPDSDSTYAGIRDDVDVVVTTRRPQSAGVSSQLQTVDGVYDYTGVASSVVLLPANNANDGSCSDKAATASHLLTDSPLLPPRNLATDIDDRSATDINSSAALQQPPTTSTSERVPNYSSLTARESLESLRRRQQLDQPQLRCTAVMTSLSAVADIDADGTYDTIDYDRIQSVVCSSPSAIASVSSAAVDALSSITGTAVVYSNGSDLYAEIGTGSSSAHSSTTYARVTDLPVAGDRGVSRDLLIHEDHAAADDCHPAIAQCTASLPVTVACPVYAVVSKRHQRRPSSGTAQYTTASPAAEQQHVRTASRRPPSPAAAVAAATPQSTYATIDDMTSRHPAVAATGQDYDIIAEQSSDYDPNYETVLTPTDGGQTWRRDARDFTAIWPRREHIYQELSARPVTSRHVRHVTSQPAATAGAPPSSTQSQRHRHHDPAYARAESLARSHDVVWRQDEAASSVHRHCPTATSNAESAVVSTAAVVATSTRPTRYEAATASYDASRLSTTTDL